MYKVHAEERVSLDGERTLILQVVHNTDTNTWFVQIREWIDGKTFQGFTKKGWVMGSKVADQALKELAEKCLKVRQYFSGLTANYPEAPAEGVVPEMPEPEAPLVQDIT
jgi:hypothetical protein